MMQIGSIIKNLRTAKSMTQEQLAAYLQVSAQAISRWETEASLPDITLLPVLANVFHVTTDHLLGVDIAAKEAKIEAIIDEGWNQNTTKGNTEAALAIFRKGLEAYPDSYKLMGWVVTTLHQNAQTTGLEAPVAEEIITMGEKVLAESTDTITRGNVIQALCHSYAFLGEAEKATTLALSMPSYWLSQNELLASIYHGTKWHKLWQENTANLIDLLQLKLMYTNHPLDDGTRPYTTAQHIQLLEKSLAIYPILFEDGQYGFHHMRLAEIHLCLAQLHLAQQTFPQSLSHLEQYVPHAIQYDTNFAPGKKYSCLLLQGMDYGQTATNTSANMCQRLLLEIAGPQYDPIRPEAAFQKILAEAAAHAN